MGGGEGGATLITSVPSPFSGLFGVMIFRIPLPHGLGPKPQLLHHISDFPVVFSIHASVGICMDRMRVVLSYCLIYSQGGSLDGNFRVAAALVLFME
jgi:hypothetical protein